MSTFGTFLAPAKEYYFILKVKTALKRWKEDALASCSNPDALLFYFCGHGGDLKTIFSYQPRFMGYFTHNFIFSKKISYPGHSPFESNAVHQEYEDTLVFSGSVGNISVGGDVLIDNNGRRMFKDEIMQTICKVLSSILKFKLNGHLCTGVLLFSQQ